MIEFACQVGWREALVIIAIVLFAAWFIWKVCRPEWVWSKEGAK